VQCGATAFVRRPGELEAFVTAVAALVRHWGGGGDGADLLSVPEEKHGEANGTD